MTDSEKIAQLLDKLNLTQAKFSRLSGVSASVISKLKGRKGSLHEENSLKIQRTFHVKQSWWETQKGDIFEDNSTSVQLSPQPDDLRDEVEELRVLNTHYKSQLKELRQKLADCQSQRMK